MNMFGGIQVMVYISLTAELDEGVTDFIL